MRALKIVPVLLLALLLAPVGPAGARTNRNSGPNQAIVLHPHWRRVASGVQSVAAGGGFLALTSARGVITLLNERTGGRTALSPPDCPTPVLTTFGGAWLAEGCEFPDHVALNVDLYSISARRWVEQPLAPQLCSSQISQCLLDAVGTTWIRFFTLEPSGCSEHCGSQGYLQNITTGAVQSDPANTPGRQDSLSTASGVGKPCPTLHSSAFSLSYLDSSRLPLVPYWLQLGPFVLTTGVVINDVGATPDRLQKCHARISLKLPRNVLASLQAILWERQPGTKAFSVHGLFLPALRSFVIPNPKGTPVELSGGNLYDITRNDELWVARLPLIRSRF